MKIKIYSFLFIAFFITSQLFANVVTVKEHVTQTNGSAVVNAEVKIAVYLATGNSCNEQTAVTDKDGYYSKELSCNGDIRKSKISVKNCDGSVVTVDKEVPVSKIVEANFKVCVAPAVCAAKFTAEPVPVSSTVAALTQKFNSSSSEVGNGDKIIHRSWDFHDGTPLLADRVDPVHNFPRSGTFEVCLTIQTAAGCESRICKQVVIQQPKSFACDAKFTFENLGPKKFRFNSTGSTTDANDNIIQRKWDFRDGSTSNEISPAHEFAKPGNYEVCLSIKTAAGCESRTCAVVKVGEVQGNNAPVNITSLYPQPVHDNLNAVIFCQHNNTIATISIVDAFGVVKSSKKVTLAEGYNPIIFSVNNLVSGSYFIRVSTQYGTVSKGFYKA